jgi:hypothetical protein
MLSYQHLLIFDKSGLNQIKTALFLIFDDFLISSK